MARYRSTAVIRSITREMERNAKQRARELERQRKVYEKEHARWSKEQEKQRGLDMARQEVEVYENQIEILLTLHKENPRQIDWTRRVSRIRPAEPARIAASARKVWRRQRLQDLANATTAPAVMETPGADAPEELAYQRSIESWEREVRLAGSILEGQEEAYIEALNDFSTLNEIAEYGSQLDFTFHSPSRFEISIELCGPEVIPEETKSLRASGKLSVKKTPRKIHGELYQDHVCSCILRTAREAFAVLPISELLVNALAPVSNSTSDPERMHPVYSVIFSRKGIEGLDMENLDPSDAIESFPHNGNFKASRKSGAFQAIKPLSFPARAPATESQTIGHLRDKVTEEIASLSGLTSHEDDNPVNEDDE